MKPDNLDKALAQMRNTAASPDQMKDATTRVYENLRIAHDESSQSPILERIQGCADFRTLMPAYLASSLRPSQRLLLEDHCQDCVICRKAMELEKRGPQVLRSTALQADFWKRRLVLRSIAAVAALALFGVALQTNVVRDVLWPIDVHATAESVDGALYAVWGQDIRAIAAGERLERNQPVRTGNDSGAVLRLADGSRIEMAARSEISLDREGDGVKVRLQRGNVIVTAAKQRDGHLYVETSDCTVSVVGTVFSVSAAAKGSRVSVIEGQVNVASGNEARALTPGQQFATDPAMAAVSVSDDIAWSRDVTSYLSILSELATFNRDLAARIGNVQMRFTSNLVPLLPEDTFVVASLPNVSQSLAESWQLFRNRIDENAELKDWWINNSPAGGPSLDDIIGRLTRVGSYLGPEVIVALPKNLGSDGAVILADVTSADGLRQVFQEVAASNLVVSIDQGLMVISTDADQVQRTLAFRRQPSSNRFATTALYRRLAQAYTEGVGWLLAADLEQLVKPGDSVAEQTGLGDVEQLMIEQKTGPSGANYYASLGFNEIRRGMASWLADPAPMGALDFVSPNAYGVAAVITKDPTLIFDDIFPLIQTEPKGAEALRQFESVNRISIKDDLAASLGNEFLVAVDGPILPTPSWRLVLEVNNAARLQNLIEWSTQNINREAAILQEPQITTSSETVGGRTFYSVSSTRFSTGIHYTFWMGYIIIAPSRALLLEAIQSHDSGNTLGRSAAFRSQLPANGPDYASGFVYQNLRSLTNSLPAGLPVPQLEALKQTALTTIPTLIALYGEPTRIVMSSKGVLGTNIASLAGLKGMIDAAGAMPR